MREPRPQVDFDTFEESRDVAVGRLRAYAAERGLERVRFISCGLGMHVVEGLLGPDGEDVVSPQQPEGHERSLRTATDPLRRWFRSPREVAERRAQGETKDRWRGNVWWFVLTVTAETYELLFDRDALPPQQDIETLRRWGLDVEAPWPWLMHTRSFDQRAPEFLPKWWIDKLRAIGGWDEKRHIPAADENGNPLYGPAVSMSLPEEYIEEDEPWRHDPASADEAERLAVEDVRAFVNDLGDTTVEAFWAGLGGTQVGGLLDPRRPETDDQSPESLRQGRRCMDALRTWHLAHTDPDGTRVWWCLLQVSADGHRLVEGRDAWPRRHVVEAMRRRRFDLEDPMLWVAQRRAYDHRPADRLPDWWVDKLREAGAWDEDTQELDLDEHGMPAHGPGRTLRAGDADDPDEDEYDEDE